jgi:hypothetical protein
MTMPRRGERFTITQRAKRIRGNHVTSDEAEKMSSWLPSMRNFRDEWIAEFAR